MARASASAARGRRGGAARARGGRGSGAGRRVVARTETVGGLGRKNEVVPKTAGAVSVRQDLLAAAGIASARSRRSPRSGTRGDRSGCPCSSRIVPAGARSSSRRVEHRTPRLAVDIGPATARPGTVRLRRPRPSTILPVRPRPAGPATASAPRPSPSDRPHRSTARLSRSDRVRQPERLCRRIGIASFLSFLDSRFRRISSRFLPMDMHMGRIGSDPPREDRDGANDAEAEGVAMRRLRALG